MYDGGDDDDDNDYDSSDDNNDDKGGDSEEKGGDKSSNVDNLTHLSVQSPSTCKVKGHGWSHAVNQLCQFLHLLSKDLNEKKAKRNVLKTL